MTVDSKEIRPADYFLYIYNPASQVSENSLHGMSAMMEKVYKKTTKYSLLIQKSNKGNANLEETYIKIFNDFCRNNNSTSQIIYVYDLIGKSNPENYSILSSEIFKGMAAGTFSVSKNGDLKLFPLASSDLMEGLSRSLFTRSSKVAKYSFGGAEITDLELGLLLKDLLSDRLPEFEIEQTLNMEGTQGNPQKAIDETSAILNWDAKADTSEILAGLMSNIKSLPLAPPAKKENQKIKRTKNFSFDRSKKIKDNTEKTTKRISIKYLKIFIIFLLITFVLSLASLTLTSLLILKVALTRSSKTYSNIQQGNVEQSQEYLNQSIRLNSVGRFVFNIVSPVLVLADSGSTTSIDNLFLLSSHTNSALTGLIDLYRLGEGFYLDSVTKRNVDVKTVASGMISNLQSFQSEISQLYLLRNNFGTKITLFNLNILDIPKNLDSGTFELLQNQITTSISLIQILPLALPGNEDTRYLIVVNDNNELRPAGGYLQSVGLLTFTGNRLMDQSFTSSKVVDEQSDGSVQSPEIIERLLGDSTWNFSQSNYSSDYPETARQVSWFYDKIYGVKTDGVISINLSFYEKLLGLIGPITVNNTELTSQNLRQQIYDASTKDNDLLTQLTQVIFNNITAQKYPASAIFRSVLDSVLNTDVQLYLKNEKAEAILSKSNYDGGLKPATCPPLFNQNCLSDTFHVNEANYSSNKSNLFEQKDIQYNVALNTDGSINYRVGISLVYANLPLPLRNKLQKTYFNIYSPVNTKLVSVSLDDEPVDPARYTFLDKYGLKELGLYTTYLLNGNHRLEINLVTENKFALTGPSLNYSINTYGQPGSTQTSQSIQISYPDKLNPVYLSAPATVSKGLAIFPSQIQSNSVTSVGFSVNTLP